MKLTSEQWKAEYRPHVYEDSGAECFDHEDECECEFLRTDDLSEIDYFDYEDELSLRRAIDENRVWTWDNEGIWPGIHGDRPELIITEKPWATRVRVA